MLEKLKRLFSEGEPENGSENQTTLEGELMRLIQERERLINQKSGSMSIEEAYNAIVDLNRRIAAINGKIRKSRKVSK